MSTPNNTVPDFYEPWQAIGNHLYDRLKHHKAQFNYGENTERSALCVNACAGMSDPAAEIQAMRDAIREACEVIEDADGSSYHIRGDACLTREASEKRKAALAKLKTLA